MRYWRVIVLATAVFMLNIILLAGCRNSSNPSGSERDSASLDTILEDSTYQGTNSLTEPDTVVESESTADSETDYITESVDESDEIESEIETEEETYEVRLYSLMTHPDDQMQSFVIRTTHGKLIVLDGGMEGASLNAEAYMPAALRAIAGTDQTGHVEVEAWILSHAHNDHFGELRKTLDKVASDEDFVIKQIIFDFPNYETNDYPYANNDADYLELLKASLNNYAAVCGLTVTDGSTYYDDLNGAYVNAERIAEGCEMEIDGVRIEFLQTWSTSDGTVINDNSLVMRAWVDGQSVLFLQDTCATKGYTLLDTYGEKLKSDIVQMAHHGQSGVRKPVYDMIDAKVRIWPTPLWVWNNTEKYEIDENRMWVHGGQDFTESSEWDIVTCLYAEYPSSRTRVDAWKKVIDSMSIPLPYSAVATAPDIVTPTEPEAENPTGPVPDENGVITFDAEYLFSNQGVTSRVTSVEMSADGQDVIYTLEKSSEIYYNEIASYLTTHPYMVIKYKANYTCNARVQLRCEGGPFQATYFDNSIENIGISSDDDYGLLFADFSTFIAENSSLDQIARFDFTRSGNADGGILHIQNICLYVSKEAYEATNSAG